MRENPFIFGGTFNPVHVGHLHIIHNVLCAFPECRIVVVPAFVPPFKENAPMPDFDERYEMVRLALLDYADMYSGDEADRIDLSDAERRFGRKVYTSELVAYFAEQWGNAGKVTFVAGDDILAKLDQWHDAEYLKKHVRFVIFPRLPDDSSFSKRLSEGFDIVKLDGEPLDASSTQVRGGDCGLLTPRVKSRHG